MWLEVWTFFLSLSRFLYNSIVPCTYGELLAANTIDHQQYLGKWYFKAAVSHREDDIRMFRSLDNLWFTMEKITNDTLLLTGHSRIADDCVKQTWTYRIHPDRDDMEVEGKPKRRNLLWSGKWANCPECIILQEIEPPLSPTDSEDSLARFMLYARQNDVSPDVVRTFLENAACDDMKESVTPPQEKEFCT
ncbi:apolipoprotein M [Antennarius striatus]|uniref:apolipoprotein M n=1 Tax=Antennarius striatus TaxID=241820 RepID=UPI0035B23B14